MAMTVARANVWAAGLKDRPGGAAAKLTALADAGANLEFVIARRTPERPGKGVLFVTPLSGAKQLAAARKAGFRKTASLHSLRVEGPDKPGLGAAIAAAIAEAGVNLRGLSAAALGRKFVCHLAFDSSDAAAKASRALKKM